MSELIPITREMINGWIGLNGYGDLINHTGVRTVVFIDTKELGIILQEKDGHVSHWATRAFQGMTGRPMERSTCPKWHYADPNTTCPEWILAGDPEIFLEPDFTLEELAKAEELILQMD